MVGKTISHYEILEELGRGGMGVVYKALDSRLGRTVALKFLSQGTIQSEKKRTRLISEARAASALNHPNILTIHDIDEFEDQLYIVMEHLEGQTLHERIVQGPLSPSDISAIAYQIGVGLRVAHESGIIHRDIKPGNVMLIDPDRVKLMDFGLAKRTGGISLTEEGQTVGTAAYMSPEQIRGEPVDKRTDIWSFGVLLYEMLSGERAFQQEYMPAIIYSVLNENPPDLFSINPDLPEPLVRIVSRCLEKDQEKRYDCISSMLVDLDEYISSAGISISSDIRAQYGTKRSSYPSIQAAMIVVIIVLAALAFPTTRIWIFGPVEGSSQLLRVAILPLSLTNGEEFDKSVSDGLLASLTNQLVDMQRFDPRLSVISAREMLSKEIQSISQADSVFDVDLIIEGNYSRVGDRVNLLLSLTDVATVSIKNTIVLDASVSNLLAFQDDAFPSFLSLLDIDVSGLTGVEGVIGGTSVPAAYGFYLQGQSNLQRFTVEASVDEAIRLLEEAVQEDPRYALAHAGLGEAYWRKYDLTQENIWTAKAVASANLALGIDDNLAPVYVTLGLIYTSRGEHEDGDEAYSRALEFEPNNVTSLIGLGMSYDTQGMDEDAEAHFQRAIELRPDYWLGYNRLGILYYRRGRFEEAIDQWLSVVSVAPERWRGYNNISSAYGQMGRSKNGIQYLEQAILLEPENAMPYRNLAALYYFDTSEYSRAVETLEKALDLGVNEYRTWSQLANSYYWAPGERTNAANAWNKTIELALDAIRVNPSDRTALDYLASAYSNLGRFDEAMATVRNLRAVGALQAPHYRTIAQIYDQQGERDSALVYIRMAFENGIDPKTILRTPWLEDLRSDERFAEISDEFVIQDGG